MKTTGKVVAGVIVLALLAGIIFGGYLLGWWFKVNNTNRNSSLIRNGYANQQTLRDQITKDIGDIQTITVQIAESPSIKDQLSAQRTAIVDTLCGQAEQVVGDPLPNDQAVFVGANCLNGSISPNSTYEGN